MADRCEEWTENNYFPVIENEAGIAQSVQRRAGRSGFDSRKGQAISLLYSVQSGSGAHPAPYLVSTGGGGGRQGRETDDSSPSSSDVRNGGAIPPLPHMSSWHSA
jgi:hypothetical protein